MPLLEPVDGNDIDNLREGRRGRMANPLLTQFLEMRTDEGKPVYMVKVDHTEMKRSLMSVSTGLSMYIRNHGIPAKVFQRKGVLYVRRTDVLPNGDPDPEFVPETARRAGSQSEGEVKPISNMIEEAE